MQNILFIGLGLVGGSLANNLKYHYSNFNILAHDSDYAQLDEALSIGIIDQKVSDYATAVEVADIIVFATPVEQTIKYLSELTNCNTRTHLVVTDTDSTKLTIQSFEKELLKCDIHSINGRPMAGSHKSGVLNARKHLFENAYYILVFNGIENSEAVAHLKKLLKPTLAKSIATHANEHGFVTGIVSRVPHVTAPILVHLSTNHVKDHSLIEKLAVGGFRDITRMASSNARMWKGIILNNQNHILSLLNEIKEQITGIKNLIREQNSNSIYDFSVKAEDYRDQLPVRQHDAISTAYDLYVDIPDRLGVISQITNVTSSRSISTVNLKILEIREDIYGALQISFKSPEDRENVIKALASFDTYY